MTNNQIPLKISQWDLKSLTSPDYNMIHLLSNRQGNGARLKIYIALSNDIASIAVKVEEGKRFFFII